MRHATALLVCVAAAAQAQTTATPARLVFTRVVACDGQQPAASDCFVDPQCPAGTVQDPFTRACRASIIVTCQAGFFYEPSLQRCRRDCPSPLVYNRSLRRCVARRPAPCPNGQVRNSTSGVCGCAPGYREVGGGCVDVDECSDEAFAPPCDPDADCANTQGSFECRCQDGFVGDGLQCSLWSQGESLAPAAATTVAISASTPTPVPVTNTPVPASIAQAVTPSPLATPTPTSAPPPATGTQATARTDSASEDLCKGLVDSTGQVRIRKEWRELTRGQRDVFVDALRELVRRGEQRKVLVLHEAALADPYGHASNAFLHWHRHFVLLFENQLRALGPRYACLTMPYWDWSQDVKDDPMARPNITVVEELGGIGDSCILDDFIGVFRFPVDRCVSRPFGHRLGWRPPGPIEIAEGIVNNAVFEGFNKMLKAWHAHIHNRCRGTMGDIRFSPNDPLFFLHHAMVDKIFATWQACFDHSREHAPGPVAAAVYSTNDVAYPHGFDDRILVLPGSQTPRSVNRISDLGYRYSADLMETASPWSALAKCNHTIPWGPTPRAKPTAMQPQTTATEGADAAPTTQTTGSSGTSNMPSSTTDTPTTTTDPPTTTTDPPTTTTTTTTDPPTTTTTTTTDPPTTSTATTTADPPTTTTPPLTTTTGIPMGVVQLGRRGAAAPDMLLRFVFGPQPVLTTGAAASVVDIVTVTAGPRAGSLAYTWRAVDQFDVAFGNQGNLTTPEEAQRAQVKRRVLQIYADALQEASAQGPITDSEVLKIAAKKECEAFGPYGPLDDMWAQFMRIDTHTLPCTTADPVGS